LAENGDVRGLDVAAELPDLLPDPVLGCDADGAIVYWSRAAEQTYGYAADEALGRRAATLLQTRFPLPLLEITEELDDRGARIGSLCIDRELPQDGNPDSAVGVAAGAGRHVPGAGPEE
jgi:PAS domain-containing protein